jgi:hypothetical protein
MALGFFRRHQKMVIIVMVLLMGSFLIGPTAMRWVLGPSGPGEFGLGSVKVPVMRNLSSEDRNQADRDLAIFKAVSNVAGPAMQQWYVGQKPWPLYFRNYFRTMQMIGAVNGEGSATAGNSLFSYMLLVAEAQGRDLEVSDPEVNAVLAGLDVTGQGAEGVVSAIASHMQIPVSGEDIVGAIRRGLLISKCAELGVPLHPGSLADAREFYIEGGEIVAPNGRRVPFGGREKIRLEVVEVPASRFQSEVESLEPQPQQIEEYFEAHRNLEPDLYPNSDSMGVGYRTPRKMEISWLLVDRKIVERASVPDPNSISAWITQNEETLFKEVPVEQAPDEAAPAQEEAAEPTEGEDPNDTEATEEPETRREPLSPREKDRRAIEALRPGVVDKRMRSIVTGLQEKLIDAEGQPEQRYKNVLEKLTRSAQDALDQKLNLSVYKVPLATALDDIQKQAGVQIVFPIGTFGDVTVSEDLLVSAPKANGGTLGETLEQLGREIKLELPQETWHTFSLLPGAVFPKTDIVNMMPVRYGSTGLLTQRQLAMHPMILSASSGRQGLLQTLPRESEEALKRRLGKEGPVMNVGPDDQASRLVWQLARYESATSPERLTDALKQEVVDDWRMAQAYRLALEKAKQAVSDAESMHAFASENELESTETPLLSRAEAYSEFFTDLVGLRDRSTMDLDHPQFLQFWQAVTRLRPEDPASYFSPKSRQAVVVGVPAARSVLLLRRLDYVPAVESEFQENAFSIIRSRYQSEIAQEAYRVWLTYENIVNRTGFDRNR